MSLFGIAAVPEVRSPFIPRIHSYLLGSTGLAWNGESALRKHFMTVLVELLGELGFKDHVLTEEFSFIGRRADIALVLKNGVPVGVVEIKCPDLSNASAVRKASLDGMNDPFVIGQLYNYMMALRSCFGVQHVFGIVSNYYCSRIAWLSSEDGVLPSTCDIVRHVPDYNSISRIPALHFLKSSESSSGSGLTAMPDLPMFSGTSRFIGKSPSPFSRLQSQLTFINWQFLVFIFAVTCVESASRVAAAVASSSDSPISASLGKRQQSQGIVFRDF